MALPTLSIRNLKILVDQNFGTPAPRGPGTVGILGRSGTMLPNAGGLIPQPLKPALQGWGVNPPAAEGREAGPHAKIRV